MLSYKFHKTNDVDDEPNYDFCFLLGDRITYVKPGQEGFDLKKLKRIILKPNPQKEVEYETSIFCHL